MLNLFLALALFVPRCISTQLCYSGSSLYQLTTINCETVDSSYNGTWYCSKIKVCESPIDPNRQCIYTRGCAKASECYSNSQFFSGQSLLTSGGKSPAGMTISPTCCEATNFADDDATAINYNLICNSSFKFEISVFYTMSLSILIGLLFFFGI